MITEPSPSRQKTRLPPCASATPIAMEEVLHSQKYEYGGTPDVIGTFDGGKTLSVIDWKTDSFPRDKAETREREAKYSWQLAGYAIAYEEMHKVNSLEKNFPCSLPVHSPYQRKQTHTGKYFVHALVSDISSR